MKMMKKNLMALFATVAMTGVPCLVMAGEYTDKSYHDASDDINTYKHPEQRSFTGPFDYAPVQVTEAARPTGRSGKARSWRRRSSSQITSIPMPETRDAVPLK